VFPEEIPVKKRPAFMKNLTGMKKGACQQADGLF